jgi:isocitrate dehydrogenase
MQYRSTDFVAPGPGKLQLVYTPKEGGEPTVLNVYDFKGKGVALSMYNTDESIIGFAHASFKMALVKKMPLVRNTAVFGVNIQLTISPIVHVYEEHYSQKIRRAFQGHFPGDS